MSSFYKKMDKRFTNEKLWCWSGRKKVKGWIKKNSNRVIRNIMKRTTKEQNQ